MVYEYWFKCDFSSFFIKREASVTCNEESRHLPAPEFLQNFYLHGFDFTRKSAIILVFRIAQMAELVDALGSGPSGGNTVEVRVLFWAPSPKKARWFANGLFLFPLLLPIFRPVMHYAF